MAARIAQVLAGGVVVLVQLADRRVTDQVAALRVGLGFGCLPYSREVFVEGHPADEAALVGARRRTHQVKLHEVVGRLRLGTLGGSVLEVSMHL